MNNKNNKKFENLGEDRKDIILVKKWSKWAHDLGDKYDYRFMFVSIAFVMFILGLQKERHDTWRKLNKGFSKVMKNDGSLHQIDFVKKRFCRKKLVKTFYVLDDNSVKELVFRANEKYFR